MNIFVLDLDPVKAARYQCNKHVVKMVLETAQLLCAPFEPGVAPYKRSHFNHPSSIWTRSSLSNYHWLVAHGIALCDEYEHRYNKIHKSRAVIEWCKDNVQLLGLPDAGLTEFAQAMPDECKRPHVVEAYRTYYLNNKFEFAKWPEDRIPDWWNKGVSNEKEIKDS